MNKTLGALMSVFYLLSLQTTSNAITPTIPAPFAATAAVLAMHKSKSKQLLTLSENIGTSTAMSNENTVQMVLEDSPAGTTSADSSENKSLERIVKSTEFSKEVSTIAVSDADIKEISGLAIELIEIETKKDLVIETVPKVYKSLKEKGYNKNDFMDLLKALKTSVKSAGNINDILRTNADMLKLVSKDYTVKDLIDYTGLIGSLDRSYDCKDVYSGIYSLTQILPKKEITFADLSSYLKFCVELNITNIEAVTKFLSGSKPYILKYGAGIVMNNIKELLKVFKLNDNAPFDTLNHFKYFPQITSGSMGLLINNLFNLNYFGDPSTLAELNKVLETIFSQNRQIDVAYYFEIYGSLKPVLLFAESIGDVQATNCIYDEAIKRKMSTEGFTDFLTYVLKQKIGKHNAYEILRDVIKTVDPKKITFKQVIALLDTYKSMFRPDSALEKSDFNYITPILDLTNKLDVSIDVLSKIIEIKSSCFTSAMKQDDLPSAVQNVILKELELSKKYCYTLDNLIAVRDTTLSCKNAYSNEPAEIDLKTLFLNKPADTFTTTVSCEDYSFENSNTLFMYATSEDSRVLCFAKDFVKLGSFNKALAYLKIAKNLNYPVQVTGKIHDNFIVMYKLNILDASIDLTK